MSHENRDSPLGRGRREKKLSQRASEAQESGQVIPGTSSPDTEEPFVLALLSRQDSPQSSPPQLEKQSSACLVSRQDLPQALSPKFGKPSSASLESRYIRPPPAAMRKIRSPAEYYGLGPDKFAIYLWQPPRPKDFLDLQPHQKSWKARADRVQKQQDVDFGQDDWDEFDNSLDNRGIASAFMKRAKRAFWAGETWEEFEQKERSIIPIALDASGRQVQNSYCLDNNRRMEIFEAIAERLCEEIWLQEYVPEPVAVPQPSEVRRDSANPSREREPTKAESEQGIIKVTMTVEGIEEPWYEEDKVINPCGLTKGIRMMKMDAANASSK